MTDKLKKCPKCAEMIQHDARVCRYCRHKFGTSTGAVVGVIVLLLFLGFCASVNKGVEEDQAKEKAARDAIPPLTSEQRAVCNKLLDDMKSSGAIIDRYSDGIRLRRSDWAELDRSEQGTIIATVACAIHGLPVEKMDGIDQAIFIRDAATNEVAIVYLANTI